MNAPDTRSPTRSPTAHPAPACSAVRSTGLLSGAAGSSREHRDAETTPDTMGMRTTCIGAWPKPGYVKLPDCFNAPAGPDTAEPTRGWRAAMDALGEEREEIIARGVAEAVRGQVEAGAAARV